MNLLSLTKGPVFGLHGGLSRVGVGDAIAASATNNYDFDVSDFDNFTVLAAMSGAAITDLVVGVEAFDSTGAVVPINLAAAITSPANIVSGGNVYAVQQYDTRGLSQVRVTVKNANAGAQTVRFVEVRGGITGVDF